MSPGDAATGRSEPETSPWSSVRAQRGRRVARVLADARPRQKVAVTGLVTQVRRRERPGPILEVDLEDGTGEVTLVYLGRTQIPGMAPGAVVVAEATLIEAHGRRELLNPKYRFELPPTWT